MCSDCCPTVVTPCGLSVFINISYSIVLSLYQLYEMDMLLGGQRPASMQQSLCPSVCKFHLRHYPNDLDEIGDW